MVSLFKFRLMPILNFRCIISESCQVCFGMRDHPRQKKSYWVELSVHVHGTWKKPNGSYVRTRCMPAVFSLYVWVSLSISKLFYLFDFESKTLLVCQMHNTCEILPNFHCENQEAKALPDFQHEKLTVFPACQKT